MNIPSPDGKKWQREVLKRTIRNPHYIGKVVYNHRPKTTIIENGEIKSITITTKQGLKKLKAKMGNKMNEGMIAPYKKVLDRAKKQTVQ